VNIGAPLSSVASSSTSPSAVSEDVTKPTASNFFLLELFESRCGDRLLDGDRAFSREVIEQLRGFFGGWPPAC
jgi:hypothetical protein